MYSLENFNMKRESPFCMQVEYIKCKPWDDRLPLNGRCQGQTSRFFKFCNWWNYALQILCDFYTDKY